MACAIKKIDANSTGLRYAEEDECIGVLPDVVDQIWYPAEPNSYSDFGGQLKLLSRRPINASRQNQKGVITDLDASGGYNTDLTGTNLQRLERSFFFADMREMYDSQSIDNERSFVTVVEDSDDTFRLSYGDDLGSPKILAQSLLLSAGFATAANNGLNVVNSITRAKATGTLTLTPGAIADDVVEIGGVYYQFAADPTTGTPNGSIGFPFLVDVGGTDTISLANLRKAINATGTPGTTYSEEITSAHPTVTATASNATTLSAEALSYGYAGNSITTSVTATGGSDGLAWGATTLTGGTAMIDVAANLTDETVADPRAVGTLTLTPGAIADDVVEIDGVFYQFAADPTTGTPDGSEALPYLVDVGVSDTVSLANLRKAINATGVPGVTYAAEITEAHASVEATASNATTLSARARDYGALGNNITTSVTIVGTDDGLAWGATTLTGGADSYARVQVVGYEFAVSTLDVSMSFTYPRLVRASGAVDFTTLGLVAGQFIYVGGDDATDMFVNDVNNGWARVRSVAASYIELDKTVSTMVAETGTSLTIRIFYSKVIKNETAESGLIVRHSFQFERDLAQHDTTIPGHQGEYLVGAVANEHTLSVKQADKVNADLTFIATDNEQRTQEQALKSQQPGAQAIALASEDAFNTSTHVQRLRMTVLESGNANPTPLWGFCKEFTITLKNNNKPSKAVGRIGAFEVTAGQFDIGGKITAYFSDVAAVSAVRANGDVSFDVVFARDNYGMAYDLPLIALGDGRLNVEQDSEVELPLDMQAAEDRTFHHTLLKTYWGYLPDVAMIPPE